MSRSAQQAKPSTFPIRTLIAYRPFALNKLSIPNFAEATSGHFRRQEGPARASMATVGKMTSSPKPLAHVFNAVEFLAVPSAHIPRTNESRTSRESTSHLHPANPQIL
jgi:hypothetical protein